MNTSLSPIGITGATGQLGGRVATRLASLGYAQRLLVRDPARAPQLPGAEVVQAPYEDGVAMRAALDGISTLFLVSGYGVERVEHHYSAIHAAVAAGVERIVYTSFLSAAPEATFTHAREHFLTEQRIRATVKRYTFLRPSFYLERAVKWFSQESIVRGPAGNGTIAWIARDDLADVAVTVLPDQRRTRWGQLRHHRPPGADTDRGCRTTLSRHRSPYLSTCPKPSGGQDVAHEVQPHGLGTRRRVSTYAAIATGEMSVVSHTVQALTSHAPLAFADYLREHPESYQHITANRK